MAFLSWLADRLILCPSTDPIDPGGKQRQIISTAHGDIESWVGRFPDDAQDLDLAVIKFPGTGGRAERAGVHPAEIWSDLRSEIWTINPPGYGGSGGKATIKSHPATAEAVFDHVVKVRKGLPIVLVGNSLGCILALYLAARKRVAGVFLRNPPPLYQMICERPRYAAWNFGLSRFIAAEIPDELDAVKNASKCSAPCLFVQSECDRVVPTEFQDRIASAYVAPKQVFVVEGADHHESVEEYQKQAYFESIRWLRSAIQSQVD